MKDNMKCIIYKIYSFYNYYEINFVCDAIFLQKCNCAHIKCFTYFETKLTYFCNTYNFLAYKTYNIKTLLRV